MFLLGLSIGLIVSVVLILSVYSIAILRKTKETENSRMMWKYWEENTALHKEHNKILEKIVHLM